MYTLFRCYRRLTHIKHLCNAQIKNLSRLQNYFYIKIFDASPVSLNSFKFMHEDLFFYFFLSDENVSIFLFKLFSFLSLSLDLFHRHVTRERDRFFNC